MKTMKRMNCLLTPILLIAILFFGVVATVNAQSTIFLETYDTPATPNGGNFNLQTGTLWIVAAVVIVAFASGVLAAYRLRRRRTTAVAVA